MNEISELAKKILKFRDDRDWAQYHKPKELAVSISIESAELLEKFQWERKNKPEYIAAHRREIGEELADVMIYSLLLAETLGLDVKKIVEEKLKHNEKKYPIAKAKGNDIKYTELQS
ncbi:MAG: nucleotide pyrophosphohydrolase [Patescibacteria group bacterium]|jgi:NTP pyrophosphatase (non-canonical NTP hydrolase)